MSAAVENRRSDGDIWTDLCAVDELCERGVMEITVGNRRIAVVYTASEIYVFNGLCPHRGGPLGFGKLTCALTSNAEHERVVDSESPMLVCPWHGWEFSLLEGTAVADKRKRLRRYPASVRNGRVLARLKPDGASPTGRPPGQ